MIGKRFFAFGLFVLLGAATLFADESNVAKSEVAPLCDAPETLKRLDPVEPIWVTADRTALVMVGKVSLREGLLEFFACRAGSKEYESIVAIDVKPYLIHAGLLVIGAKKGHPFRYDPEFIPAEGEKINIVVRWKGDDGEVRELPAGEWVRNGETGETLSTPWVFTGSISGKDQKGNPYYMANITGELIGVSNFAATILDLPIESSSENENLLFEPNTEKIPPPETEVTLVLRRADDKEDEKE